MHQHSLITEQYGVKIKYAGQGDGKVEFDDYIFFETDVEETEHDNSQDLWFVFEGTRLMIKVIDNNSEKISIPVYSDIKGHKDLIRNILYIGKYKGRYCYASEIEASDREQNEESQQFVFEELRALAIVLDEKIFHAAGRAAQLINWDKDHKFCGRCGAVMKNKKDERAKICPQCNLHSYPGISPAVIVAVKNENKLLLAHNRNFKTGLYSLVAGFVEPGETFEESVKREVFEEVGVKVKNIKYFGSQPWPFPNSLMIGFTAEYAVGEVKADGIEIEHADWYEINNLPLIPAKGSVARKIIDSWKKDFEIL